jgi:hypothetical protein
MPARIIMDLFIGNIRRFNPYRVNVPVKAWFYNTLCPMGIFISVIKVWIFFRNYRVAVKVL